MKSICSLILLSVLSSLLFLSSAQRCMPGSFNSKDGMEPCFACPRGRYSKKLGRTKCRRCPEGQSTVSPWSRNVFACRKCPEGMSSCRFCPPGSFGRNGVEPCSPCTSGTSSSGGVSECTRCDYSYGLISGGDKAESCKKCPFGSKANVNDFCVRNSPSCSTTSSNVPQSCRLCQPGTYSDNGYEPCAPCPRSEVSIDFGSTTCMQCKFGSFTTNSGGRSLGVCESAFGGDSVGDTLPTRTPTPTPVAQPGTGAVCRAGSTPVGNDCVQCAPGSFKSSAGTGECEPCEKNTFQDERGQAECKPCETNFITSGEGSTKCFYCPNEAARNNSN